MKKCRVCNIERNVLEFYLTPAGNPKNVCKICEYQRAKIRRESDPEKWQAQRRATIIKFKYGISQEQYAKMLDMQDGRCAICKDKVDYLLHVDHCHISGAVRGLLCKNCNWGIGNLKDDVEILRHAIAYLERV